MSMNTVPERLAALRAAMKANGVDVYLIPVGDPHASEYMPDHYTALTYFCLLYTSCCIEDFPNILLCEVSVLPQVTQASIVIHRKPS